MHLNDKTVNAVDTPCTKFLPLDEFRSPAHEEFSYPSIVGQLNYLHRHSTSDIIMATLQCAHYDRNPKQDHKLALICIGQYLKGTLDKGLIFKPINAESIRTDVYVDDPFAFCLWMGNRTGYKSR